MDAIVHTVICQIEIHIISFQKTIQNYFQLILSLLFLLNLCDELPIKAHIKYPDVFASMQTKAMVQQRSLH